MIQLDRAYLTKYIFLLVSIFWEAQQTKVGVSHIFEVSRSHAVRRTHPVVLLWRSDELIAETAACTT